MKILAVSDRVEPLLYDKFNPGLFPGVELILSCGDVPPEYLIFLANRFNVPLFYVQGNHDIRYEAKPPDGCTNLNARVASFQGFNFLGLNGSRWYNGGQNQYTEGQMRVMIRGLRREIRRSGGLDIVITHAPPRFIHDAEDPCHKGFRIYRWLIDKYAPRYFIHGHIHCLFSDPSERISTINETRVINAYGYYFFETKNNRASE